MKTMENRRLLNEVELDRVSGGILPIFNLGPAYEPTQTEEPHDGGATGGW